MATEKIGVPVSQNGEKNDTAMVLSVQSVSRMIILESPQKKKCIMKNKTEEFNI